ncbi:MAG: enoyl-CoA hydratase [Paracrocinitomix sp.]|jgi:enoyl-CoA hydratase
MPGHRWNISLPFGSLTVSELSSPMQLIEATPDHPVHVTATDGIATVTMHRPDARNAINPAMRRALWSSLKDLEANDDVLVMVLTGTDPAFTAGLDLKLIGQDRTSLLSDEPAGSSPPFPPRTKPLIGAINGVAITGGFELALNCDFLIASEHARFADTHARVGVMPGWGLTALLTDAVGRTRARQISLTGDFVTAPQALAWGLVNEVVPHDALMDRCYGLAASIVDNDQLGVRQMLATYASQETAAIAQMWELETAGAASFGKMTTPGADVAARRKSIMERGRSQLG